MPEDGKGCIKLTKAFVATHVPFIGMRPLAKTTCFFEKPPCRILLPLTKAYKTSRKVGAISLPVLSHYRGNT